MRKNIEQYMLELKAWLSEEEETPLEEMSDFFTARIEGYEEHMSPWTDAYKRFGELLPQACVDVLDLGCGSGLELEALWQHHPRVKITGVDLCEAMLAKLRDKYKPQWEDGRLTVVCADYMRMDLGENRYDAVISFESLHHFQPKQKQGLYKKIAGCLKPGGVFLLADYMACCEEEETLLADVCKKKRKRAGIAEDIWMHFDIPLTVPHELELLKNAGLSRLRILEDREDAVILMLEKQG